MASILSSVVISNKLHSFLTDNTLKFVLVNYDKREHNESAGKKNTSIRQSSGASRK